MKYVYVIVRHVCLLLQGCLVTLCVDSSLHLWQLNVHDGESFIEEVKSLSAETRSG